jgi:predicted ATPase
VFRRGAPPEASYAFKHALVRDAAYASLLTSRRRQLHGSIAAALVGRWPEIAADQPELLARHHAEAGAAFKSSTRCSPIGPGAIDPVCASRAIAPPP